MIRFLRSHLSGKEREPYQDTLCPLEHIDIDQLARSRSPDKGKVEGDKYFLIVKTPTLTVPAVHMSSSYRAVTMSMKIPFVGMAGPIFMALEYTWISIPSVIGMNGAPMIGWRDKDPRNARFFVEGKCEHSERRQINTFLGTNERLIFLVA